MNPIDKIDRQYEVLCDDGETVTIYANCPLQAMINAAELGFKPVEVEASYEANAS